MKFALTKWLFLGLALLALAAAVAMARVHTGQLVSDANTDASLPPIIAATSIGDLFAH
jgi:hypothetical protein